MPETKTRPDPNRSPNRQALLHLLRFERKIIHCMSEQPTPPTEKRRYAIAREASLATALIGPSTPWCSRPQSLAVIAALAGTLGSHHQLTNDDIERLMMTVDASWDLDPKVKLEHIKPDDRYRFDLHVEDLTRWVSAHTKG